MTMPLYLAGASRELARVLPIVAKLEASGLVRLTYPWWEAVQRHGVGNDGELSNDERRQHALNDVQAVGASRVLWLLYPNVYSTGAFFEFGYAARSGPTTMVTGARIRESIFAALASFEHESDGAGIEYVLDLARAYNERPWP